MLKITDASIKRMSLMSEENRFNHFLKNPTLDLEAIVKKARFLAAEAQVKKDPAEAQRLEEVIETAAILYPGKKFPTAVL
jgi:hypothetical protein